MAIQVQSVSDSCAASLAHDIERQGYAMLPNFLSPDDLARMRRFVADSVRNNNGEYAGLIGPDAVAGSGLDDLARSATFRDMMERIYEKGTGLKAPPDDFYQLLRCLTGSTVGVHSYVFHYDSYVLTMLIPIEIPTTGQTGDLLLLPNTRRLRKRYVSNVVDKAILDNAVSQWILRKLTVLGLLRMTRLKMIPGTAYFFWGYRTVHTNEPCDANQVRATALFHYVNPHAGASRRWLRRSRQPMPVIRQPVSPAA
jgi:hypothetical protein